MNPLVVIVGRQAGDAKGVRGAPFAAGQTYFSAVERAGGIPLMLPPIRGLVDDIPSLLRRVDAVVFHGGGDIDPRRYGQEPTEESLYGIVPEHDAMELAMVTAAIEADKPVLAICRGLQVLNVALGGTLVQDIGTEDHWLRFTAVELEAGSRIAKAMGAEAPQRCHCVHHQALDRLGEGLRVVDRRAGGIIHAVELDSARWIVGIQWHPEDSAANDPEQQGLFDELVRQAT
ncbi:MAG: gamma-glutamyl-gamma-aminobutyrate hydrolase family protein [Ilumatobacteraceae bacterium]